MQILVVSDRAPEGTRAFDLIDLLRLLESELGESEWRLSGVECVGENAEQFHEAESIAELISGPNLARIATGVTQIGGPPRSRVGGTIPCTRSYRSASLSVPSG